MLKEANDLEAHALEAESKGFPLLFELAITRLWGQLEASIEDYVLAVLTANSQFLRTGRIGSLKLELSAMLGASPRDQATLAFSQYKQEIKSSLKRGVGRFESVLDVVGLAGGVPDSVSRTFVEFSEIRNCIMHRMGRADRKFLDACPWLPLQIGDSVIRWGQQQWLLYFMASHWYAVEVYRRSRHARLTITSDPEADFVVQAAAKLVDSIGVIQNTRFQGTVDRAISLQSRGPALTCSAELSWALPPLRRDGRPPRRAGTLARRVVAPS